MTVHVRPRVIYMAHPVGADASHTVADNVARAERWFVWLLVEFPCWSIVASWIPYVKLLGEDGPGGSNRARGLRDNCAVVARCDGLVHVGGWVSSGMEREAGTMREVRIARRIAAGPLSPIPSGADVYDLSDLGEEPPAEHGAAFDRCASPLERSLILIATSTAREPEPRCPECDKTADECIGCPACGGHSGCLCRYGGA